MSVQLVNCVVCGKKVDKNNARYKGSTKEYSHKDCVKDDFLRTPTERESLENYICAIFKLDSVPGRIHSQINHYERNLGYTTKGIELTLRYFHEILGNGVKEGSGIGIVPYVYEAATEQFRNKLEVKESVKEAKVKEREEITVYLKKDRRESRRKKKDIDIESIE